MSRAFFLAAAGAVGVFLFGIGYQMSGVENPLAGFVLMYFGAVLASLLLVGKTWLPGQWRFRYWAPPSFAFVFMTLATLALFPRSSASAYEIFKSGARPQNVYEFKADNPPMMLGECPDIPCIRIALTDMSVNDLDAAFVVNHDYGTFPYQFNMHLRMEEGCWAEYYNPNARVAVRFVFENARLPALTAWVGVIRRFDVLPHRLSITQQCGEKQLRKWLERRYGIKP